MRLNTLMKRICFVVSEPMTARSFLLDHIQALAEVYEVTLVANFSDAQLSESIPGVSVLKKIPIVRSIKPIADLYALILLFSFFRKEKFSAVHSVTPKAGLLAMLAGWVARVPCRFHTFTGQVWVNKHGALKWLLMSLDKLVFSCSSSVLVDSPSQRDFLILNDVISLEKSTVLGDGSICGVNSTRFRIDDDGRNELRKSLNLPDDAFLFLFLGRINRDKGIDELILAFSSLQYVANSAYLMLVGPEEDDVLNRHKGLLSGFGEHYIRKGYTSTPQVYMAAADVFCLPSHREGFGSVILEAAATGTPAIGSNIYGITDAIVNGVTGLLHNVGDAEDLSIKMNILLSDKEFTAHLGQSAYSRALTDFSVDRIVQQMVDYYRVRV